MKTNNKLIVYDDNCPLCNAYTSAFVKTGFLGKDGRMAFSEVLPSVLCNIDTVKGRNEIPLIDTVTNQTWYGIDAMLEVLSTKCACIKTVGNIAPIKWLLVKLYKFISYNRKVIVAVPASGKGYDCTPSFNIIYRLAFIVFGLALFYFILNTVPESIFSRRYVLLFSAVTAVTAMIIATTTRMQYRIQCLGQLVVLLLIIALLLVPLKIINGYVHLWGFNTAYLLLLLFFIVLEAKRRYQYLKSVNQRPLSLLK